MNQVNLTDKIIVIAGPSGAGKSSLSYALARQLALPIVEADDIYHAIQAVTTPEQQPWIHFWETHPEANDLPDAEIIRLHIEVCRAMSAPLAAVIDNHIRTKRPILLEGDYILPELVAKYPDDICAIYVMEEERDQLVANFLEREPHAGEQIRRADSSVDFGGWLARECEAHGLDVLPARPWPTVVERALAILRVM